MENREMKELDEMLFTLEIGEGTAYRNLAVFPIFSSRPGGNGYTLLEDALKKGKFSITEISESGSVPNLRVINRSGEDVLILDGEALVGAKQNRVVNTTIIVGKEMELVIPVSCVERGRWRHSGKNFAACESNLYSDLRKKKAKSVSMNLKSAMSYVSDQGEIWKDIEMKSSRLSVRSGTDDMHDIYKNYDIELKEYERSFSPAPEQVGFIAVIDNKVAGCDIFSTKDIFSRVFKNFLKGYVLDALDREMTRKKKSKGSDKAKKGKAELFMKQVKAMKRERFKSVGEGEDVRLESRRSHGFALVHKGHVVHLAAFSE